MNDVYVVLFYFILKLWRTVSHGIAAYTTSALLYYNRM